MGVGWVKLAYRLLLIVGHTLGDLALPLMRRQCERVGGTLESLSPAQADKMIPALEGVLQGYLARQADMKPIVHELRLEVGAERFARGEVAPGRVHGSSVPRHDEETQAPREAQQTRLPDNEQL